MKIAVLKERRAHEKRVAATPETVKKYLALGAEVWVESGAGVASSFTDSAYEKAGAVVEEDPHKVCADADIVLKVQRPLCSSEQSHNELAYMKRGVLLLGLLSPYSFPETLDSYADANVVAMSLELVPRITRAQSMDVLSSQSNLGRLPRCVGCSLCLPTGHANDDDGGRHHCACESYGAGCRGGWFASYCNGETFRRDCFSD